MAATGILIGCWTLTAVVFLVLTFRFAVKSWIAWAPLSHGRPHRVWGYEDIFFALGYGFDVAHTALLWKRYELVDVMLLLLAAMLNSAVTNTDLEDISSTSPRPRESTP